MKDSLTSLECKYRDGQIIFCEYEHGDSFYFIKSGQIKLIRQNNGEENILDILTPGVFFGEMSIIDPEPRAASAIAYGDVELIKFTKNNFESIVLENATLTLKLIRTFVSRIWSQQQRLHVYKFSDPEPRIIAMLLNLKTKGSEPDTAIVHANIEDISKWVGVSVMDTKKVLQSLVASRILTVQNDNIVINDTQSVERLFAVHKHQLKEHKKL